MVTLELMKSISAAFNSRDPDRIVSFFAEDGVFCLSRGPEPVGRTLAGKAAIRKALADRFVQIPDMRWENEEYILAPEASRAISVWTAWRQGRGRRDAELSGLRHLHRSERTTRSSTRTRFWKIVQNRELLQRVAAFARSARGDAQATAAEAGSRGVGGEQRLRPAGSSPRRATRM